MSPTNEDNSESEESSKWRAGGHTSIAGSLAEAAERAHQSGATALQIFSSSPRMWRASDFSAAEISRMRELRRDYDLTPLVIHCSYLINMASPDEALRQRSTEAFVGEIRRAEAIGAEFLVLHPGSFRDSSPQEGIGSLTASIRAAIGKAPPKKITILVENMCGQGNVLGGTFEQLAEILAPLDGFPVDCCIDTAHCYAAGMDVSTAEGLEAMVASFEAAVGWRRVPVIHANDCASALGSHLDRHQHIGEGQIGLAGFRRIVNHPVLRDKAFILETPVDEEGDGRRNLEALRTLRVRAGANPVDATGSSGTTERRKTTSPTKPTMARDRATRPTTREAR
jgi:deoxyribonuclease-4